jgi:hypothetical protein
MIRLYWQHGHHIIDGEIGDVQEHHADYNSYEEALLQAAHMLVTGQGPPLRIEEKGERVAWDVHFNAAAEKYRQAIADGGPTETHVEAMRGVGRSG